MKLVKEDVADGVLLKVIESFLKAGVLEDGAWQEQQGGNSARRGH